MNLTSSCILAHAYIFANISAKNSACYDLHERKANVMITRSEVAKNYETDFCREFRVCQLESNRKSKSLVLS
jgi:hypothetical protein